MLNVSFRSIERQTPRPASGSNHIIQEWDSRHAVALSSERRNNADAVPASNAIRLAVTNHVPI